MLDWQASFPKAQSHIYRSCRHSIPGAAASCKRAPLGSLRTDQHGVCSPPHIFCQSLCTLPSLQRAPVKPGKQSHRPVMWWQGPLLCTHCGTSGCSASIKKKKPGEQTENRKEIVIFPETCFSRIPHKDLVQVWD